MTQPLCESRLVYNCSVALCDYFPYQPENYIYIRNLSNQVILVRQSELSAEDHAWLVDLLTRHLGAALA